jgi:lipopolysaccharide/colanic/teichoic acid biosynthesis glycosyltransferase
MSQKQRAGLIALGRATPAFGAAGPRRRGRLVRRALDLLVASIVLVAVAPMCLLIAILVKLDSKGPVFVAERHFGRNGRRFSIPKFRTMAAGGRPHLVAGSTPDETMRNDPRLTRVGRLLRRLGLDELPTLWSVLIGDLSLVGPHPVMARSED